MRNEKSPYPTYMGWILALGFLAWVLGIPYIMNNGFWIFYSMPSGAIVFGMIQKKCFEYYDNKNQ